MSVNKFAEFQAINTTLQGSNADIIKKVMAHIPDALYRHRLQVHPLLQAHDVLVFEVPDKEIADAGQILKDLMESVVTLKVPLVVAVKTGVSWADVDRDAKSDLLNSNI